MLKSPTNSTKNENKANRNALNAQEVTGVEFLNLPLFFKALGVSRLLDIAYLTIHVDDGALAFTRRNNLPPRHFGETSQNTQHNIVR